MNSYDQWKTASPYDDYPYDEDDINIKEDPYWDTSIKIKNIPDCCYNEIIDSIKDFITEMGLSIEIGKSEIIHDINKLSIGQQVRYQPPHYSELEWENGIIKDIRKENPNDIWVVYHCDNNWDNYKNYTAALTKLTDIKIGWK
jgi:hypothetical protein